MIIIQDGRNKMQNKITKLLEFFNREHYRIDKEYAEEYFELAKSFRSELITSRSVYTQEFITSLEVAEEKYLKCWESYEHSVQISYSGNSLSTSIKLDLEDQWCDITKQELRLLHIYSLDSFELYSTVQDLQEMVMYMSKQIKTLTKNEDNRVTREAEDRLRENQRAERQIAWENGGRDKAAIAESVRQREYNTLNPASWFGRL